MLEAKSCGTKLQLTNAKMIYRGRPLADDRGLAGADGPPDEKIRNIYVRYY